MPHARSPAQAHRTARQDSGRRFIGTPRISEAPRDVASCEAKVLARSSRFSAVPQDGFRETAGASVMEQERVVIYV